MPFSFVDIEKKQSRKIIVLFLTLVIFYFIGFLLIDSASLLTIFIESLYRGHQWHRTHGIAPSPEAVLILLVTAFLAALVHWMLSIRNMINKMLSVIRAKPIDPEDRYHLLFKNIVDEVSVAMGGIKIEPFVVPSRYLNAFALSDFHGRSIIGISEGLLIKMNRRQLEGVIAHEAGHLAWGDCLPATVSCSMAAVYAGLLRMGVSDAERFNVPLPIPVMMAVFFMRFLTLFLNTWISREREIRADATAVRLTRDPLSLAEPLYLISRDWRGDFLPSDELAPIFIVSPIERKLEDSYGMFADLFTTHPPIRKRIDILLDMGHTDYKTFEPNVREKAKVQDEIPISVPKEEKAWYALNGKAWQGPFSPSELYNLKWIDPFTWMTKVHDTSVRSAYEFEEISGLFKNRHSSTPSIYACPACKNSLERVYYEGVPIWRCKACNGRLVKTEQLSRIIVREEMSFTEQLKEKVKQVRLSSLKNKGRYIKEPLSTLSCPACGNIMHRTFYRAVHPYQMEIDTCRMCALFWLDQDELEIIQYLTQGRL